MSARDANRKSTREDAFSGLVDADAADVENGHYWFTNGTDTQILYVHNFGGTRFALLAANIEISSFCLFWMAKFI